MFRDDIYGDTQLILQGPSGGKFVFGPMAGGHFLDEIHLKSNNVSFYTSDGIAFDVDGNAVGIGKAANPTYGLDVNGTVNMSGFRMATGASPGYVLTSLDAFGTGTWQPASGGGGNISGYGAGGRIAKFDTPTYISSSAIYQNGNRIGIGGSPVADYELDVYGDIRASGKYYGDGSMLTGITPDNDWTISSNDICRLAGNVGIGTNSMAHKLVVDGGSIHVRHSNEGIIFHGGQARIYKESADGLKIEADYDNFGIEFLRADGTTNMIAKG